MKNNAIALLLLLGSTVSHAQQWSNDLKTALSESAAQNKLVLLYFTGGSDCPNCVQLEQQVLSSRDFLDYASRHFMLVRQDFQSRENIEENLLIVEKYNKDGFFPLVVLIGSNARALGHIGVYQDETPQQYIEKLRAMTNR